MTTMYQWIGDIKNITKFVLHIQITKKNLYSWKVQQMEWKIHYRVSTAYLNWQKKKHQ